MLEERVVSLEKHRERISDALIYVVGGLGRIEHRLTQLEKRVEHIEEWEGPILATHAIVKRLQKE